MNDHWWRGAGFVSSFVTIQLLRFLRSLLLKIALDLPRVLRVLVGLLAVGGFLACGALPMLMAEFRFISKSVDGVGHSY